MNKSSFAITLSGVLLAGSAGAVTILSDGGNLNAAGSWDNGLPGAGNDGLISVDGTNANTVFGFGGGAVITHSAGTITSGTLTNDGGFNFNQGDTWNMTGGEVITRYFLANNSTFNLSGGVVTLKDVAATRHMGAANGGFFNVSGSVVLDGSNASTVVQTGGTIDIAAGWTGSWTWGLHTGDDWKNLFTSRLITYDGAVIDAATFDSTFTVSDGGQTLSIIPPGPETDFLGGDMLVAGNWSNGLPLNPPVGTVATDGIFNDNAGVADWLFSLAGGAIAVSQDWHFTGNSGVSMSAGTLDVVGDILAGDESTLSFSKGVVSWGGSFEPAGTPGGKIAISGGTFTGTSTGTTSFGNVAGGTVSVSGGSVTSSIFNFAEGVGTTIRGGAVLSGESATFGALDILRGWSGSFTLTSFSGTDWETQFTTGNITVSGEVLDAAGFAQNFVVTDGGQRLSFNPATNLIGGDINSAASWSNGSPSATTEATIAVDGSNSVTVFGFGGGATINQTAGTIAAADGFNFNRGDTWNMSGGSLIARYILANGAGTTINLTGGSVILADVEGAQQMGAANGGIWNVSGSAVLDGSQATTEVQTNGSVNIASDWSGSWTWGFYTGSEWQDLFLAGLITLDNAILDLDGFRANFSVSADGTTLSRAGGAPKITEIVRNPNGTVTLTWESRPGNGTTYSVFYNSNFEIAPALWGDENDSIATGGETTTYTTSTTFNEERMFFIVRQN